MTALFVPDLVSIVVVGHDNWPELEQAVRSGLEQSYRSIEVVVIDNASTDATPLEVPRRFAGSIRYIRQENCGDGGGYNRGITESRGEFIHLLDGDDVMARNMVEIQVAMLKADAGLDAVYGDVCHFVGETPDLIEGRQMQAGLRDYDDLLAAMIRADDRGLVIPSAMLFRRSTFERVGAFLAREGPWDDLWWVVDREYLIRSASAGCRFRYSPGALLYYRIHGKQMTADIARMERGTVALLERNARLITSAPYQGLLRSLLARKLWSQSVTGGMRRRDALRTLSRAHKMAPEQMAPLRYMAGLLLIALPGGAWAYRLQQRLRGLQP